MGLFKDEKKYGKDAREISGLGKLRGGSAEEIRRRGSDRAHMHIKTGVIDSLKDTVKFLKGK